MDTGEVLKLGMFVGGVLLLLGIGAYLSPEDESAKFVWRPLIETGIAVSITVAVLATTRSWYESNHSFEAA